MKDGEPCTSRGVSTVLEGVTPRPRTKGSMAWRFLPYELYTMQRYLQYDRLQELGMAHFDCWASRFGETVTALELAPEGTGYRARTRFSMFFNLPELMNLFKEVGRHQDADQLHLPTPPGGVPQHRGPAHRHPERDGKGPLRTGRPKYTGAAWTHRWTICSRSRRMGASWAWTSGSSTRCCRTNRAPRSTSAWTTSCRSGGTARPTS